MPIDENAAYQALTARDARFDGLWFVGVTSTRVYCRPICRVRTPRRENCRFFDTPAQAESAAFRPCLKCRPEIAPGAGLRWTVMDASRTLARQAAEQLGQHAAQDEAPSVAALAARLGVSDRHLRRIFLAEHGVTPLQYLQTRRLLLAKQLLTDTRLPMVQVALSSGFRSLRRFNAAFMASYRMSPSRLRGDAGEHPHKGAVADAVTVSLAYRDPCDVDALLRFIEQRAIPGVEAVVSGGINGHSTGTRLRPDAPTHGHTNAASKRRTTGPAAHADRNALPPTIRRTVRAGVVAPAAGWIEAQFSPGSARVTLRFAPQWAPVSGQVVAAARQWLDLDASPHTIDAALAGLPGPPGLRLPGSLDAFELAVRAILGQQVTVAAARTLARRVVEAFGTPLPTPWPGIDRAFPAPEAVAALPAERIAELGIVRSRALAIVALAQAWPALALQMQLRPAPDLLIAQLQALPGIGPWTAHYICMRALGWPDAFPPHDVALLKAMKRLLGTHTQRQAEAASQAWRPWRSYAVLRLWGSLAAVPALQPDASRITT